MKDAYIYKSAITGKIVTEEYAMRNPDTTFRERIYVSDTSIAAILRKFQENIR